MRLVWVVVRCSCIMLVQYVVGLFDLLQRAEYVICHLVLCVTVNNSSHVIGAQCCTVLTSTRIHSFSMWLTVHVIFDAVKC